MLISSLFLINFRNYKEIKIVFYPQINVLYGLNGQGKTNIVEAINYLSILKSFRNIEDNDLIKSQEESFLIQAETIIDKRKKSLKAIFCADKRKLFINDQEIKKNIEFFGILNAVVFAPSDVSIFTDVPERRRKFLDRELCKLSPSYLYSLTKYKNILKERNQILKDHGNRDYLQVLSEQLGELADYLVLKRQEFIKSIEELAQPIFSQLYGDNCPSIVIYYHTYKKALKSTLEYLIESLDEDIAREKTTIGPHYDDFIVYLDDKDISAFGSQGQQRLAILSIKLGLLKLIETVSNDSAIVILDDVMSELDILKRKKILEHLSLNNQVFITTANKEDIAKYHLDNIKYYKVNDGNIEGE